MHLPFSFKSASFEQIEHMNLLTLRISMSVIPIYVGESLLNVTGILQNVRVGSILSSGNTSQFLHNSKYLRILDEDEIKECVLQCSSDFFTIVVVL